MADCKKCNGKCCNYITIQIKPPEEDIDFEELKWFLCHENIIVYIDNDGEWCVEVATKCKNIDKNNRCMIYPIRPKVCSDHKTADCEANDFEAFYKRIFTKMEDIDAYKREIQLSKQAQRFRAKDNGRVKESA